MTESLYQEAAQVFAGSLDIHRKDPSLTLTGIPVPGGLINHTFKINGSIVPALLLQQINDHVFKSPVAVQENYIRIWKYIHEKKLSLPLPEPVFYQNGHSIYQDRQGKYWRAFKFIEEGSTRFIGTSPEEAWDTAQAFARFTAAFDQFKPEQLHRVIPDFHDLSFRFEQFKQYLGQASEERKQKAQDIIEELLARVPYKNFYDRINNSPSEFILRVMHHDAKIANVLFHHQTGKIICAVDFDTVMPGHYFSDLGDLIRSMACSKDEASIQFEEINIRPTFYEALLTGYRTVMDPLLTPLEKKYLHHAGLLMIYMQALRFMGDYLNNDRYYRIQYPEQNFDRGKNQLWLLKKLEDFLTSQYNYTLYPND